MNSIKTRDITRQVNNNSIGLLTKHTTRLKNDQELVRKSFGKTTLSKNDKQRCQVAQHKQKITIERYENLLSFNLLSF